VKEWNRDDERRDWNTTETRTNERNEPAIGVRTKGTINSRLDEVPAGLELHPLFVVGDDRPFLFSFGFKLGGGSDKVGFPTAERTWRSASVGQQSQRGVVNEKRTRRDATREGKREEGDETDRVSHSSERSPSSWDPSTP